MRVDWKKNIIVKKIWKFKNLGENEGFFLMLW